MDYEYYDRETDKFYSYDEALEILQERYSISFDYTENIEQTNKQFEVMDILLTNIFEVTEKQGREYIENGYLVADYT